LYFFVHRPMGSSVILSRRGWGMTHLPLSL
jgi:hypothetical protein